MTGSHRAVEPGSGAGRPAPARRLVVVVLVVVALLVAAGVVVAVAVTGGGGSGPAAGVATGSASARGGATRTPDTDPARADAGAFQDPSPKAAPDSSATPTTVTIPAIGVSTPLEDLHRDGAGALSPPVDYDKAGWFTDGVRPGQIGPAVIAGHVDSPTTAAVFFRLDELVAGDQVQVGMSDGSTLTFVVQRSERAAKNAFPTSDVYGSTPTPTLRLITCDGTFDTATGHYTDNLIVFAALSAP